MRLTTPRIEPSEEADWEGEQQELMAKIEQGAGKINVMRTLVRHPKLMKRWLPFTNHILFKSSLAARDREIVILRVAWNSKSEYEWGQHIAIARREGLTDEEINRVGEGAEAEGWSEAEAALIRTADDLEADSFITDPTWQALTRHFSEHQVMDAIMTVGNYRALAGFINSTGVQLDEGVPGFPK